jgi:hypothetical protein
MEAILYIFIVLLSLIYWCINEKKCLRIGIVLLFSLWLSLVLNHIFAPPHPTDVLVGLLIAGLLLGLYFLFAKRIETLFEAVSTRIGGTRAGLTTAAALSFIMILYRPSEKMLIPAGMLLGLVAGYYLNKIYIGFTAATLRRKNLTTEDTENTIKTPWYSVVKYLAGRFILGAVGLFLLFYATGKLNNIFNNSENYNLFIFLRYALLALWISAGAPWLFRFTRLAEQPK